MPSDPSGPLQGCSPQTLTTQALLCHLSPTRKPCSSDTGQPGSARSNVSRLTGGMRENTAEEEDIKSSTQREINPSAPRGCRLSVWRRTRAKVLELGAGAQRKNPDHTCSEPLICNKESVTFTTTRLRDSEYQTRTVTRRNKMTKTPSAAIICQPEHSA